MTPGTLWSLPCLCNLSLVFHNHTHNPDITTIWSSEDYSIMALTPSCSLQWSQASDGLVGSRMFPLCLLSVARLIYVLFVIPPGHRLSLSQTPLYDLLQNAILELERLSLMWYRRP